jgi:hypothetical protein
MLRARAEHPESALGQRDCHAPGPRRDWLPSVMRLIDFAEDQPAGPMRIMGAIPHCE